MAHKKGGGSTRKNRDSAGRRLGVKLFGSQKVGVGNIIIRQRGTKFHPGAGTKLSRDHTILAIKEGTIKFRSKFGKKFVEII